MNKIMNINVHEKKYKVFLQNGFFDTIQSSPQMHKHCYTEVHIISGKTIIISDNKIYDSSYGNIFIIPAGNYHSVIVNEYSKHSAFQIDYDTNHFAFFKANESLIEEFFMEIETPNAPNSEILAYIQFFCNLYIKSKSEIKNIIDYRFLIYEFFSVRYGENIHLKDLADILVLSERQTERLVKKYTGNSFSKELSKTRINIAKELMNTTDIPLSEIANYVGFMSYNDFWKSMKKHKESF